MIIHALAQESRRGFVSIFAMAPERLWREVQPGEKAKLLPRLRTEHLLSENEPAPRLPRPVEERGHARPVDQLVDNLAPAELVTGKRVDAGIGFHTRA
jgi:hypothetical protein